MSPLPDVRVNFSDLSDEDLLPCKATQELTENARVDLYDGDGNTCDGTVVRIEGVLAWVLPDWQSWKPVEPAVPVDYLWMTSAPVTGSSWPLAPASPWEPVNVPMTTEARASTTKALEDASV